MTISPSSYAVGARVYRGGSSAPTRGTVDPMGYVDRSLNQPSDSRSGLAAAALRQLQGMGGPPTPGAPPATGDTPSLDMTALQGVLGPDAGGSVPVIPTVRDAVRARMNPDGTYTVDVKQIQEQVAHAHDYAQAAQRALSMMAPLPSPEIPIPATKGASNGKS